MIWRNSNNPLNGSNFDDLGSALRQSSIRYWTPATSSKYPIANDNPFNGYLAPQGENWFTLRDANFIKPRPGRVVPSGHIGIVSTLSVDLCSTGEQDHGARTHFIAMFYFATF
jgi:hypothetical protein